MSNFVQMNSSKKIILLFCLVCLNLVVDAQCAMCKATLESDLASGGAVGKGINHGILYLMAFPYLIFGVGGYFIYRHLKNTKTDEG